MKTLNRSIACALSLVLFSFVNACSQNPRPTNATSHISYMDDSLVNYNKMVMETEDQQIDDFVARYGWDMKKTSTGLRYLIYQSGMGSQATTGVLAQINYELKLLTGEICYSSDSTGSMEFIIGHGGVISGLEEGILLLREGDHAKLIIPSHLGYGLLGDQHTVPPRATLLYDIELVQLSNVKK